MKIFLRIIIFGIPALIFLSGFCVLFYPAASDLWNQHRQNNLISDYTEIVNRLSEKDYSSYFDAARGV
ncbi:MAG: hypothetical protein LUD77_09310 [Clostridiales bacterium]|nr:hypothetical protein [Clostridiales bacterium]